MEDTGEWESESNSETTNSHNKNNEQDISHEIEPTNTSNSQENIENNDIEREENVTLQNQEVSPEKNITQSSTEKHSSHDTKANNSKRLGNKKSVVILGDRMSKLLNGWEMAKRIQANCKNLCENIFRSNGFMYGGLYETVLKKSPRSFHFACWGERSIL